MEIPDKEKQDRLYTEVRYARDPTLSLPKKSELFRLKDKYKPLPVDKFISNLKVYLGKVFTKKGTFTPYKTNYWLVTKI